MISGHEAAAVRIDVALTPALLGEATAHAETTYIVVDVIRATTTLCVFFEHGAREALLALDVVAARAHRDTLGADKLLLAGEIEGAMPPGFDLGNSPAEAARADLAGRTVLFATSNGTRALRACAGGRAVFAGALRNAAAVAAAALASVSPSARLGQDPAGEDPSPPRPGRTAQPSIVVVCSGRGPLPAYDDTLCTGYIVRQLIAAAQAEGRGVALHEGAHIALGVLAGAEVDGGIRAALARSDAFAAVERIGLAGDLDWCAAANVTSVVPQVVGMLSESGVLAVRSVEQGR